MLIMTGGRQKADNSLEEWLGYEAALALSFQPETKEVKRLVEYITPETYRPSGDKYSVLFKAAGWFQNKLAIPTQTEILIYNVNPFALEKRFSIPWLNDVHHVTESPRGHLLIANTGLDAVLEVSLSGEVINEWSVLGDDIWQRFDRNTDYRKILTTKPHRSHPNYCFIANNECWVTRFEQKDALCLESGEKINIGLGYTHDGFVLNDMVYFTTVNGYVAAYNIKTGKQERLHDLNQLNDSDKLLGWCRGLYVYNPDRMIIGFSRLRPSKIESSLLWVKRKISKHGFPGALPTRIAMYDFSKNKIEWEVNLEKYGMHAVFSIMVLPNSV